MLDELQNPMSVAPPSVAPSSAPTDGYQSENQLDSMPPSPAMSQGRILYLKSFRLRPNQYLYSIHLLMCASMLSFGNGDRSCHIFINVLKFRVASSPSQLQWILT